MELSQLECDIELFVERHLPDLKSMGKTSSKVVHDGLWRTFKLHPEEVAIIDTPLIQRLRQIRQTGNTYLTYPSTTHTRFEHTLGVIQQVQELGTALISNQEDCLLRPEDIRQMRMAALLHDVGHGPLSHTSEEYYSTLPQMEALIKQFPSASPHEMLGYLIVRSKSFKKLCKCIEDIYAFKIDIEQISNCIIGKYTDPKRIFVKELINGPFDADKLDYIFRDSHFSGLPLSIDLHRLWYTVKIADINGSNRLVMTQSGAVPLEQILFSKMTLFTVVYQHHKVRVCDCMFKGIIEYMKENGITFSVRGKEIDWKSPSDFLWITDSSLMNYGYISSSNELHSLIHNLYFRRLLKRAVVFSRKTIKLTDSDNWDDIQRYAKESKSAEENRRLIAREIWKRAGKPCLFQEIWLDLPEPPQLKVAQDTFVVPADGIAPVTLNELFPTNKWATQYVKNKWRGHVFCPEYARDSVAKASKEIFEENFNVKLLPSAFQWCKISPP